jgi:arylsulfatase
MKMSKRTRAGLDGKKFPWGMANSWQGESPWQNLRLDGYESGTTVSPDYTAHGSMFNGKIDWVQIHLGNDAEDADHFIDHEERLRVRMARQ